jgi:hypothetical protein
MLKLRDRLTPEQRRERRAGVLATPDEASEVDPRWAPLAQLRK